MKERSILMSPGNAIATGNETKTQTRRGVNSTYLIDAPDKYEFKEFQDGYAILKHKKYGFIERSCKIKCPYGQTGDRLWIKESFYAYGIWIKRDKLTKTGKPKHQFVDHSHYDNIKRPHPDNYRYSDNPPDEIKTGYTSGLGWYKRPSMFMPRIASRYTVEIVNVRIEQLGDITATDALAEGINWSDKKLYYPKGINPVVIRSTSQILTYKALWESINGAGSWNPELLVWVIEYKLISHASPKE